MSRSGYSEDCENIGLWRNAVSRAIKGKRGQAMLIELLAALDAMPEKKLIDHYLVADGEHCALGILGAARGIDMEYIDVADYERIAEVFGVSRALVQEIEYENDEACSWDTDATPEQRWTYMRNWVTRQLVADGGK